MRPERINWESSQQDFDGAVFVCAAQEDDCSQERQLEIKFPTLRKGMAWRSSLDAWCRTASRRIHKAIRLQGEGVEIFIFKTAPDLGLPAAVVVLDRGLEASLFRRCKNGCDAELQTEPYDAPERIAIHSISQED